MAGQERRYLALDRFDGVASVGAGQHEEHIADAVQIAPAILQRLDGIGEGRRLRIGGDGVDLGAVRR